MEMEGIFLCICSVEATQMWQVRDLDLGSMISLSTRLNKFNTRQANYIEGLYHEKSYMVLVGILSPLRNIKVFIIFQT